MTWVLYLAITLSDPQGGFSSDNITKYYRGYTSDDACAQAAQQIKSEYREKYGERISYIYTSCSQYLLR